MYRYDSNMNSTFSLKLYILRHRKFINIRINFRPLTYTTDWRTRKNTMEKPI